MVTFGVTNLYSNIPHELGKQAILFWIEKYQGILHPRFKKRIITDDIEEFDSKNYTQVLGTIMGTKIAALYVYVFLFLIYYSHLILLKLLVSFLQISSEEIIHNSWK